ncbi:putative caffeine synthase 2 [Hordeum vulgare]|nr:putative caffeine synthase 2 [Hordeum vulgare]
MEKVEGLLHNLKLSEKERKGVKIGWAGSGKVGMVEPQALAKLLSEKPVFVEAMAETLGRIWCPIKGLECKEVGENIFLFTFGQESGKRLALEGGAVGVWE